MKLSSRARYALRAMMVFAREEQNNEPVQLRAVAERTDISKRYLEQVAISLKNAGLLKAVPGKYGGHLLTRPAAEITLDEIIEAAIGPLNIVQCVNDPESCVWREDCHCRGLYVLINESIKETLRRFSLADLAHRRIDAVVGELTTT